MRVQILEAKNGFGEVIWSVFIVNDAFTNDEFDLNDEFDVALAKKANGTYFEAVFHGALLPRRFRTAEEAMDELKKCGERALDQDDADIAAMLPYDYAVLLAEECDVIWRVRLTHPEWREKTLAQHAGELVAAYTSPEPPSLELAQMALPMVTEPMGRAALLAWLAGQQAGSTAGPQAG